MLGKKAKGGKKGGKGGGKEASEPSGDDGDENAASVDTDALMKSTEEKLKKSIVMLQESLVGIRAGKATPALLENVTVTAYEADVNIKEVASITISDTRTLTVSAFDEAIMPSVEKGILNANLGYSVTSVGNAVKVLIPQLTTDKRAQFAKLAKDNAEKSKAAMRSVRQAFIKQVKGLEKKKSVSEDISRSMQGEIEAFMKKYVAEVDAMTKKKETEIMNA